MGDSIVKNFTRKYFKKSLAQHFGSDMFSAPFDPWVGGQLSRDR